MKSASGRLAGLLIALATIAGPVYAHAPYERLAATIADPQGRQLQLVAYYTDGIVGADPVTIFVRDTQGGNIAQTEPARDAIVRCPSYKSCRVYLYEPPLNLFPSHVLRLEPSGFVHEAVDRHLIVGGLLPLWHHFPRLLIESLAFAVVPIVAQLLAMRRRTPMMIAAWFAFIPLSLAWLSFWWLGVMLNTLVPLVWIGLAAASLAVLPTVIRSYRAAL